MKSSEASLRLDTPRLVMRPHVPGDYAASHTIWSDPNVTRHITGVPSTLEQTWARMLIFRGHWEWMGYGYWVVEEKSTGDFVGEVGFADFKRVIEPPLKGIPDLGWMITPSKQGKGYATEAAQAAMQWGRDHLPTPQISCIINAENLPSVRVAEKCGFQNPVKTTYKEVDTLVYIQNLT